MPPPPEATSRNLTVPVPGALSNAIQYETPDTTGVAAIVAEFQAPALGLVSTALASNLLGTPLTSVYKPTVTDVAELLPSRYKFKVSTVPEARALYTKASAMPAGLVSTELCIVDSPTNTPATGPGKAVWVWQLFAAPTAGSPNVATLQGTDP